MVKDRHAEPEDGDFVDEAEAARRLGVAVNTLRFWRKYARPKKPGGAKLDYYKMYGKVRYRITDIESFIEACRRGEPIGEVHHERVAVTGKRVRRATSPRRGVSVEGRE